MPKHLNISAERLRTLDSHDMLGKTLELPAQVRRGFELGRAFARNHTLMRPDAIEWYGLGGSAVAGDLVQSFGFTPPLVSLRIQVCRNAGLAVDPRVLSSYSGNTIETVTAFKQVPPQRIWFSMSSGGELARLAQQHRVPHLELPGGYPPRAALGFGMGAFLTIIEEVHGFDGSRPLELEWSRLDADAAHYAELDRVSNLALAAAEKFVDRTPVIYAIEPAVTGGLAFRFRTQLAENAKVWSHVARLPEMAHNEVEAWPALSQLLPQPLVVFLGAWRESAPLVDPRPALRELLDSLRIEHVTIDPSDLWPESEVRLEAGLRSLLFLDAISIYLALLRATDPFDIPNISRIKTATTRA
jgi:glucose/mannose-6-phosphate isomerase